MYQAGDYIVYGTSGVCRVDEIKPSPFEGEEGRQYYTLTPVTGTETIYIPVDSPEEALAEKISLREVIETLPEQDRQLIRLRFYENKTQSETAKALHTTQVQISRRERKILTLLRRCLMEE